MSIFEQMVAPPTARNADLDELIEKTRQQIYLTDETELARLAAHEYDEEVVAPQPGSAGAKFLREVAQVFTRWIAREGRFPNSDEVETEVVADEVQWHREASGSLVAQAFVDLGLFYSHHADAAHGATVEDLRRVLNVVADALIFTLAEEYGPLV